MTSHPLSKIYTKICASDGDKIIINLDIYPKARQFDNHHLTKVGKTIRIQVETFIERRIQIKTKQIQVKEGMGKDIQIETKQIQEKTDRHNQHTYIAFTPVVIQFLNTFMYKNQLTQNKAEKIVFRVIGAIYE